MDVKVGYLKNECTMHEHKFYEIIVYTKGSGIFQTTDTRLPFSVGTVIVVPPGTPHESLSDEEFDRIFINGKFDWILKSKSLIALSANSDSDGLFLADLIYRNRYSKNEYLVALTNAFISYILQNAELDDKINEAIKTITKEITENFYDSDINLRAILNSSGYSEDYIRAMFKKSTGKTPVELLTEVRINHACLLIDMYKNSLALSEIAEKCGYTDYIYFSRRFKEIMGISPLKYRLSLAVRESN